MDQEDYLEIIVDNKQVELGPCVIELPLNVPFVFIPKEEESITVNFSSSDKRKFLRIPKGLPAWKLRIARPFEKIDRSSGLIDRHQDEDPGIEINPCLR
jgi:hypothetical protein